MELGAWSMVSENPCTLRYAPCSNIGDKTVDDLISKALNTEQQVAYQSGSVVSKEILKKETGTVTIFAFDKGQGLSEHTAPFDALVFIIDGEAVVNIDSDYHRVAKGEFIIMPANKPHSLQAEDRFKMVLVMIRSN